MNLLIAFLNLRRIDVFLFIGIKGKPHKNICKRIFFAKMVYNRPGSEENVFFFRIFKSKPFFCKKNYSENQSHDIQSAENIFSFLKCKKSQGIYVLCFKASKMLRIGRVMRVLQLSE